MRAKNGSASACLRARILKSARELFLKNGFEGVSVRQIAARAGCSPGMLYHFFSNKELLLARVVEDTFARLEELMSRSAAGPGDPLDRLRHTLKAYVRFGLRHPHEYLFLFVHGHGHLAPDVLSVFETRGIACYEKLRLLCEQCARAGLLRAVSGSTDEVAQALWASIHGLIHLLHSAEGFPFASRERLIEEQLSILMAGIQGPGGGKAEKNNSGLNAVQSDRV